MVNEKTLVLIKPDGVRRMLVGEVLARFERRGIRPLALKMMKLNRLQAETHYAEHVGKPFFPSLVNFITSGPIVAMVLEGPKVIQVVRTMMGATNPVDSAPGTIRGDFALTMDNNIIHGSDGQESAAREIAAFFSDVEVFSE